LARKILLADDSVTAQNMGRKILADAGYEVITVNNGSAALKKVAETRPDVIVLDVYMPGYSGLEVCQRLKEVTETARIPILLTVGKLEPFKPEEAKRARADGFIVKPFEASELLSALTKLEDKIVPRPEPSKPGRFARAIAAVEEGRYDKSMATEEDSGWKDRISFPSKKKKKAAEPEDDDDPAIYNPLNKDLRTVIDRPHTHTLQAVRPEDPRLDLGALAPHGLPKDVTPEEIAALAAAAAQIKGTGSEKHEPEGRAADAHPAENRFPEEHVPESRVSEEQIRPPQVTEPAPEPPVAAQPAVAEVPLENRSLEDMTEVKQEPPAAETPKEVAVAAPVEAVAEPKAEEKEEPEVAAEKPSAAESEVPSLAAAPPAEVMAAVTVPEPAPFASADRVSGDGSGNGSSAYVPADEPVTMAVAAGAEFASSESRWMAVPVSLLPEEAAISLEQEMQKTCAALAAAEMAHAAAQEPVAPIEETQPAAVMAPAVEAPVAEPPVPATSMPEIAEPPAPVTSMSEMAEPPAPVTSMPEMAEPPAPVTSMPEVAGTMSSVASEAAEAIQAAVKEFETVAAQLAEAQPAPAPEPEPAAVQTAEPVAEPAVEAPPAVVEAKVEEKVEEKFEEKVEEKFEDKPVVESAAPEPEAEKEAAHPQDVPQPEPQALEPEKKPEEPQPQVEAAAPAEITPSAEIPETAAPVLASEVVASEVPAEPALASQESPHQESPQMTEAPVQAEAAAGGIEDMAKKEKEIAATTAAAWASWRRIRETGDVKGQPSPEPPAKAAEEQAPAPPERDEAAMAVAAGAEKAPEEAPAESGSESAEIASIVDSVLADLRPKIVEEISRKLGKKKK
jgi:CheY-like chemotaxis protein